MSDAYGICLVAFLVAWAFTDLLSPAIAQFAVARGWVDPPDARKLHQRPIARLGGVALAAGFAAAVGAIALLLPEALTGSGFPLVAVLSGALGMFVLGLVDDFRPLPAKLKLAAQLGIATAAILVGMRFELGLVALPLTLLWLVAIPNVINLIDGLDGLAGGLGLIAAIAITLIAGHQGLWSAALLAAALAGAVGGFLRHNWSPAKLFMGDSGSLTLGYLLAVLCMTGVVRAEAPATWVAACLLIGVPLFDTTLAVLRRTWRRKSIFAPDRGHIHHRLLRHGFSHGQAAALMHGVAIVLAGGALVLVGHAAGTPVALVGAALAMIFVARKLLGPMGAGRLARGRAAE